MVVCIAKNSYELWLTKEQAQGIAGEAIGIPQIDGTFWHERVIKKTFVHGKGGKTGRGGTINANGTGNTFPKFCLGIFIIEVLCFWFAIFRFNTAGIETQGFAF